MKRTGTGRKAAAYLAGLLAAAMLAGSFSMPVLAAETAAEAAVETVESAVETPVSEGGDSAESTANADGDTAEPAAEMTTGADAESNESVTEIPAGADAESVESAGETRAQTDPGYGASQDVCTDGEDALSLADMTVVIIAVKPEEADADDASGSAAATDLETPEEVHASAAEAEKGENPAVSAETDSEEESAAAAEASQEEASAPAAEKVSAAVGETSQEKVCVPAAEEVSAAAAETEDPTLLDTAADVLLPDAPYSSWYLEAVDAAKAWKLSTGAGVLVAVIDTGVDFAHPDLADAEAGSFDVIPDSAYKRYGIFGYDPSLQGTKDNVGHGTAVASVIAGSGENGGVTGIAPDADILSIKSLDLKKGSTGSGTGTLAWTASAINKAVEAGARVINLSIGMFDSPSEDSAMTVAIKKAYEAGVVVVCATGNSTAARHNVMYPAALAETIAVSAVKYDQESDVVSWWSGSCYGEETDVAAPGVGIYAAKNGGGYTYLTGTSLATPIVTGAVASLLSLADKNKVSLSVEEIRTLLTDSATDMGTEGEDEYFGAGLVNVCQLLKLFQSRYVKKNNKPAVEPYYEDADEAAEETNVGNTETHTAKRTAEEQTIVCVCGGSIIIKSGDEIVYIDRDGNILSVVADDGIDHSYDDWLLETQSAGDEAIDGTTLCSGELADKEESEEITSRGSEEESSKLGPDEANDGTEKDEDIAVEDESQSLSSMLADHAVKIPEQAQQSFGEEAQQEETAGSPGMVIAVILLVAAAVVVLVMRARKKQ